MLQLAGVSVVYPGAQAPAVSEVNLEVGRGEAVAVVGPSGSGKTTLLRLLGAVLRPSSGRVRIAGREVAALPPRALRALRAGIGTVHQDLALVPTLRVVTNVIAGRLGRGSRLGALRRTLLPRRREVGEVYEVLERVGIGDKLYQRTDRLSGGQQQRVALARALFQQPEVLLADEPVSSVDPARARDTMALLAEVCRERDLTLVASMHDVVLARAYFPRLVGLRRGRIVFDRPAEAVSDEALTALYTLEQSEMLADG